MKTTNSVSSLKYKLKKENLDGVLISDPANVSYLSGFRGGDSYILLTGKKDFFITDFRYLEQAKSETDGFVLETADGISHFDLIAGLIQKNKLGKVGFEAKRISYGEVSKIRDRLKKAEFLPTYDLVESFRVIKTRAEIKLIKKAIQIDLSAFKQIADKVKAGNKERDLASMMEYQMRLNGAASASFETIVLSGRNSSLPHGRPSEKSIKSNELVLIDAGANFNGYNSDLTRIFFLGRIQPILKKIYCVVKTAQEKAIKAIKPGIMAARVDAIARGHIKKYGWDKFFGHGLGHGVGRKVHEAPSISTRSKYILKPGMVFTVEPAVYIPGVGGVRIEDMVLVTQKGVEVLSR